ncbi:hypothetical protein [Peptostreptococcus equinus]|uniref:Uncharacterized protein n=1 Tax=Peptostreptococcus equinus TaxID=3003601 RepID=A0ABY7JS04_9FIRM|nr:hypothetical protein [Peptostreptococcus sp. CBA3647]WAW14948.1 hypothetical protein O0R46_00180 [Peptostreptococcus sp. CBA3647]
MKNYNFDENRAMNLLTKKHQNSSEKKSKLKDSKFKRVNDSGVYRNNARHFQFDYEEDYYEPNRK